MKTQKHLMKALATITITVLLLSLNTVNVHSSNSTDAASEGFGDSGTVMTSIGNGDDIAQTIAIQTDGKLVVAGYTHNGTDKDFAVVRYNSDGSLDVSFGTSGIAITHVSNNHDEIRDIAIQPDGKIVAVGETRFGAPCCQFAMARYNIDGSLDPTFGSGGIVFTSFSNNMDGAYTVAFQEDGKILVAGNADFRIPADFAIARYNPDGSLDTTFDGDGKVTTSFSADYDMAFGDIFLQADDKILVTGIISTGAAFDGNHHFGMARYNPDGSLDTTFAMGGYTFADFSGSRDFGTGSAYQADGKILITGELYYPDGSWNSGLARFNPDGSLDTTFGNGSMVVTDINNTNNWTDAVAIQSDGKIVLAGNGSGDFSVLRFNQDGGPDTTFGDDGYTLTDFFGGDDYGIDLVIQEDGRIVLAGMGYNGTDYDFALARYNPDGSMGAQTQPPVAEAGGPYTVDEGDTVILDASGSSDPDNDIVLYEWDLDNDGEYDDATGLTSDVSFDDNGVYAIGLKVTDAHDEFDTDAAEITVQNVAPTIEALIVPVGPIRIGATIETSATFTDPGVLDTHTAHWEWGDGTSSEEVIDGNNVDSFHAYNLPGLYTATLTMTDDDGDSDTETIQYAVVYDPEGGFVTGGGWFIDAATGLKAHFNFNPKYHKNSPIPRGKANFRLGDMQFNSTSLDWLVVNGTKAQFKGTGTINESGEYGFLISAIDGAPDKFRIEIWDQATEVIVYDNQPGAADDVDPITAIEGGSIIIHQAK